MTAEMRIQLRLFRKLLPGYAFFIFVLLALEMILCIICGSIVGVIQLFIAFVALRYCYDNNITYHNESTKICIAMSIALFCISSVPLMVFNVKVSLLAVVPVAILMTWFLHEMGIKDTLQRRIDELNKPKLFDLDNCTEEELIQRCKQRFKRDVEYKTERAIKHFILKLPHEQIDVNPNQSKVERYRFRQILK